MNIEDFDAILKRILAIVLGASIFIFFVVDKLSGVSEDILVVKGSGETAVLDASAAQPPLQQPAATAAAAPSQTQTAASSAQTAPTAQAIVVVAQGNADVNLSGVSSVTGNPAKTENPAESASQPATQTALQTAVEPPAQPAEENVQTGLVNINTADSEELQTLRGIGKVKAQAIINYRQMYGGFRNIEEITLVSGIGEKTFDSIKDYITV